MKIPTLIVTTLAVGVIGVFMGSAATTAETIDTSKILDLTYTFDSSTIYWPTEKPLAHEFEHFGKTKAGYFYSSGKFAAPEHGGTHMDAPVHFNERGNYVPQVPLGSCIGPAAVVDFSARAAGNPDATLGVADLKAYEQKYGRIPSGAIVVARSGWGRFWPDKKRYLGTDKPNDVAHLRFPGFSPESIDWLLSKRDIAAIAIDTASIDPGNSKDFRVHQLWLGANRPAFENVANADRLPPKGATMFCIPMKLGNGTGAPARIFALMP